MAAPSIDYPRCANCGVEIPWRPAVHRGKTYCCGGCVQGGPCYCSYDLMATTSPLPTTAHQGRGAQPDRRPTGVAQAQSPARQASVNEARVRIAMERASDHHRG